MILFKPKWKSNNYEKRLNWIKKTNVDKPEYQDIFVMLAKNDDHSDVRKAAVEKLTDQMVLIDLAKNDRDEFVRIAAMIKLTDQEVLAYIAKMDKIVNVRKAAVEKLTDQLALADVAKNDKDEFVRIAAMIKLNDQEVLAYIAKMDKIVNVRKTAVEKLTDQVALADVAKNDKDVIVREAAIEKLTDQEVLAYIAKIDKIVNVRKAAVEKLTDQVALADVAKNDKDESLHWAAIRKLNDQEVLAYIAKKDEKYYFRKAAVEKLTDQVALADIAINDKDVIVREAAIEMLTDHAILADIAKNMDDYAGYSELVNIAISRLTDQNVLTEVAKNAKNYSGRQIAFKKLGLEDSQEALADRALSDEELSVCMAAVYKLTDQGMLTYMTKNSQYHEVRQIAFKKLGLDDSQEALLDRVDWNPRVSIRIAAVDKLVDQKVLIELAKCSDDGVNIAAVEKLTDQAILADIAKNAADHHVRQTAYKKLGLEESQEALADRTEIALILAKRAKPAAKKGIDLLQEVYTRNDLLYPTITEKIEKAKKELKIGGIEGSKALANLIIDMLESRCSAISSALNIAKELTPTPQLLKAIQSVLSSGPLKAGSSGRFTPEIIGGGKIGWTDGTYKGIKELANESLTLLSKKLIL